MLNRIKHLGKAVLCQILEAQVKRLRSCNQFKVVAVAGSVGKTSTKLAIAKTLSHCSKVIYQDGNYNDQLTVPLVIFGHAEPAIFNILAWLKIIASNEKAIRSAYPYDIAVRELGTDAPGQLASFAYLQPDILVLTAVAAEHMEFFGTLDAVAAVRTNISGCKYAKLAIAKTLSHCSKVIYQDGNYNDQLTVPLVIFGHAEPAIFNILAWLKIIASNEKAIRSAYPYDIAVRELGTDAPGQLASFAYLQPDILVLTAVAAEHMEFFGTLDAVAAEELAPIKFSKQALLNLDDISPEYLADKSFVSYGSTDKADYRLLERQQSSDGQKLNISLAGDEQLKTEVQVIGIPAAKAVLAAVAVACLLKWPASEIREGLRLVDPVPGRMQLLAGVNGSKLIDDTYNASPIAVKAALDSLYEIEASQRVAILGTMNELGASSATEHKIIGAYCDPGKLNVVITIGDIAERYLAPVAKAAGCEVASFKSPHEAGEYAKKRLKNGAVILAKGSQNGVFAEEALKPLLRDPADASKLVRQSTHWLSVKQRQFN